METLSVSRVNVHSDRAFARQLHNGALNAPGLCSLASTDRDELQAMTDSVVEKAEWYEAEVVRLHNQLAGAFGLGAPVEHFEELVSTARSDRYPHPAGLSQETKSNPKAVLGLKYDGGRGEDQQAQVQAIMHFEPCRELRLRLNLHPMDRDFVSHAMDKQLSNNFKNDVSDYIREVLLDFVGKMSLSKLKEMGVSHARQCFRKVSAVNKKHRRFYLEFGAIRSERGADGFIGGLREDLAWCQGIRSHAKHSGTENDASHTACRVPAKLNLDFTPTSSLLRATIVPLDNRSDKADESHEASANTQSSGTDDEMPPTLRSKAKSAREEERPERKHIEPPGTKAIPGPPFIAHAFTKYHGSTAALRRWREFGGGVLDSRRVRAEHVHAQLRSTVLQDLKPWRQWSKAAKDVLTTVWSPDGNHFAIGAASDLDPNNIQYNDRGTLLYGDLETNELRELDDHKIARFRTATGANSLTDTMNTLDPYLYTSVTGIRIDGNRNLMYTSSYDRTMKIWNLSGAKPFCQQTLQYPNSVEVLDVAANSQLLATGQDRTDDAVTIFHFEDDVAYPFATIGIERATKSRTTPMCLQFGQSPASSHLLVAGFSENSNEYGTKDREGELCVWDVSSAAPKRLKLLSCNRAVNDAIWSPQGAFVAAAVAADLSNRSATRHRVQSHIRTWSPLEGPNKIFDFDCPALDVNELRFHPVNSNYISASCTDGVTYIWDARMAEWDRYFAQLKHGYPIESVDDNVVSMLGYARAREELDTGVRFAAWSGDGSHFYSGSSDGVVKQWNPWVAEEDALVKDVLTADSGITSGSFSPDHSHLLIGLANGAIRILSSAPLTDNCDTSSATIDSGPIPTESINFIPVREILEEEPYAQAANHFLQSGELAIHPYLGAMKGPCYKGPYAGWARKHAKPSEYAITDLDPDVLADQIHPSQWQKGLEAGGIPTVAAHERQRWLQQRQKERGISASHKPKRRLDTGDSDASTPMTPAGKRRNYDLFEVQSSSLESNSTGYSTPVHCSTISAHDTPTLSKTMPVPSNDGHLGRPVTPTRLGTRTRTPGASQEENTSTSDASFLSLPIRTPSSLTARIKSSPHTVLRPPGDDNYTPRPKPQFYMPRAAPESPSHARVAARTQNQQSARAAANKGELIVLDDDDA